MAVPRSPLEQVADAPLLAQHDLRAEPGSWARLAEAGISAPTRPNSWITGRPSSYWIGPDELLLVGEDGSRAETEKRVREALGSAWFTLTDVSDQRTAIELSGRGARELLAAGCSLDLDPRRFAPGDCAQTMIGRAGVLLAAVDESPSFRLFVRNSFASYLREWLLFERVPDVLTENT